MKLWIRTKMKYLLFLLAIIFILVGVFLREYLVVFRKAASICFECIGIG